MNEIEIFNYNDMPLRTIDRNGERWWALADVCKVLGIVKVSNVAARLDDDEKGACLMGTPSGKQSMTIINEPGLYNVILRSDKPDAKDFKRWVTHDVLPSIRKTGAYSIQNRQPEVTPSGLANLIRVTRRVMLDMGSTPQEVGQMVYGMFKSWNVPLPGSFTERLQLPGQFSIWEQGKLGGAGV